MTSLQNSTHFSRLLPDDKITKFKLTSIFFIISKGVSMIQKIKYKNSSTINNIKFIDSDALYKRFLNPQSILVKIHDKIDFTFVNELCEDVYTEEGQHAYLPELVFRVSFIQFFKGGLSDNEVVRQCQTNLEYRYFCNLAIDDELFNDCKLSRFRQELGEKKFKSIFDTIVEKIKTAGFINNNDVQYLDSFLFLADVKIISINTLLSKAIQQVLTDLEMIDNEIEEDTKTKDFHLSEEQQKKRFVFLIEKAQNIFSLAKKKNLSLQAEKSLAILRRIVKERAEIEENGTIRKKKSDEEKDKIINVSDLDARMMGKKKNEIHPSYKSFVAMNKEHFITGTDVTIATVYDGHHTPAIINDLKERGFKVPQCVGDTHFGDIDLRKEMAKQGTQIITPYRQKQIINSCCKEEVMIEAWNYNHTDEGKDYFRIRSHIEPKQGEMKNIHGMKRAKFRELGKVIIQNYLSAIVTNCKKWVMVAS